MKIYTLVSEGFGDAIGYEKGRQVHWTKTQFATDETIVNQLKAEEKALEVPHFAAPIIIENLGELLLEQKIDFAVYLIDVSYQEAINLNSNFKQLILA